MTSGSLTSAHCATPENPYSASTGAPTVRMLVNLKDGDVYGYLCVIQGSIIDIQPCITRVRVIHCNSTIAAKEGVVLVWEGKRRIGCTLVSAATKGRVKVLSSVIYRARYHRSSTLGWP